ncbi:hypothetical protein R3P38DRAFT_2501522 [Favolaschia claudopus]|uniref:Uncharacterized protein n=1 Tax=Favolaschia claudopus TaxID=2862362 RepID=A0AAW0DR27_9AGAR
MFYGDGRGRIPDSDIRELKEVVWVGLNCSLDLLPANAWDYVNRYSYHTHTVAINQEGWFENMEYAHRPDWEQHDRSFRAWIPVLKGGSEDGKDLWYMNRLLNSRRVVPNPQDKWIIPNPLRDSIIADLRLAETVVAGIVSKAPFFGRIPKPQPFYYDSLHNARETQKEACVLLASAVRCMLEHLGFIFWRTSTDDDWSKDQTHYIIRAVGDFNLGRFGKRGVLLHLVRDWKEMNIPVLLKNEVPVLYPWTLHERVDLRFACLAPSVLAAYQERRRVIGDSDFTDFVTTSDSFLAVNRYSLFLDDPVEPINTERRNVVIPRKSPKVIKDFPHWTVRPVTNKKWVAYYRNHFQFKIMDGVTIFWRFRPLPDEESGSADATPRPSKEFDDEDRIEAIDRIREVYKGGYAPRPGQVFDKETGKELRKPFRGNDCFIQFHEHMSSKIPSAPSRFSSGPGEKAPLRSRPPSSRARSASPEPNSSRMIPPRPRSPTQIPVTGAISAPNRVRLEAWVNHAKGLVLKEAYRAIPEGYYWDELLMNNAYLVLPTTEARVKLRVVACVKGLTDVRELLNEVLLRGIFHRLAIPLRVMDLFAERELSMAERVLGKSIYEVGAEPDPPLEYGRGGPTFATAYHVRLRRVLGLPHARGLVARGGICSWLVWAYEPRLVDAYMSGPSIQTTRFVRGWSDTETESPAYIWADEVSEREIDGLLGHVLDPSGNVDRWVWPPDSLLREFCNRYDGEMSAVVDNILQVVLKEVNNKDTLKARSRTQWYQFFRKGNRAAGSPGSELAQLPAADRDARYEDEEERMDRLFADRWEKLPVLDVKLPGRIE